MTYDSSSKSGTSIGQCQSRDLDVRSRDSASVQAGPCASRKRVIEIESQSIWNQEKQLHHANCAALPGYGLEHGFCFR